MINIDTIGPSGEHYSMIMGEGKYPRIDHLLRLADIGGIKKQKVCQIIDEVLSAVARWEQFSKEAGVGLTSQKMIQATLERIKNTFFQ